MVVDIIIGLTIFFAATARQIIIIATSSLLIWQHGRGVQSTAIYTAISSISIRSNLPSSWSLYIIPAVVTASTMRRHINNDKNITTTTVMIVAIAVVISVVKLFAWAYFVAYAVTIVVVLVVVNSSREHQVTVGIQLHVLPMSRRLFAAVEDVNAMVWGHFSPWFYS
jgi:hypothetical protein